MALVKRANGPTFWGPVGELFLTGVVLVIQRGGFPMLPPLMDLIVVPSRLLAELRVMALSTPHNKPPLNYISGGRRDGFVSIPS